MQVGIISALGAVAAAVTFQQKLLGGFYHMRFWKYISLYWCYQEIVYISFEIILNVKPDRKKEREKVRALLNIMCGILHFYAPFKSQILFACIILTDLEVIVGAIQDNGAFLLSHPTLDCSAI